MDLFPAIDIRNGRVVRLSQGEATRQTVYGDDPVAVAERFAAQGAHWVHVVDLDRAFGDGDNVAIIRLLVARLAPSVRVQLGGGLRSAERLQAALDLGAARLVLGTAATDPDFVALAVERAGPQRLAVGIDVRDGMVAVRGWTGTADLRVEQLARRVLEQGVATLVYTDVARDGMLAGPDIAGALALQELGASVIASGGIASLEDIRSIVAAGLTGAIVGRALYEARFALEDALEVAGSAASA